MDRETRLNEIKLRVEKASKGPWRIVGLEDLPKYVDLMIVCDTNGEKANFICNIGGPVTQVENPEDAKKDVPDAQFISHSREDVPFLLSVIDKLKKELASKD